MTYDVLFEGPIFALICGGILLLGIILYLITGFLFIGKNRVGIIERVGKYIGTFGPKLYYFGPLIYRRVGYYRLGETSQTLIIDRQKYIVKYEIQNFKTWHYIGNHDTLGIVKASLNDKEKDLSKLLIDRFKMVGVRFISLTKIKK